MEVNYMKNLDYFLGLGKCFKLIFKDGDKLAFRLKNRESIETVRTLLRNKDNVFINILKDRNKVEIIDEEKELLYQFKVENIRIENKKS
ncbi:homoserine kinase [Fusobacterium phage Fnu1]|uniref:Homoserine kinase n=1 Tax=Fusobacterium phage Fnu1 TaxID=2530024 RepID=A0A481W7L8_9CAUD|nr:homoserine kinase [Fusobacterium phage Fnu1]QBJ04195.1 homoserine kinase [Fusobacterium phage Fnu1]